MVKNFLLPLLFFGLCASAQIQPIGVATNVVYAHHDLVIWSGSDWVMLNKGTNGQVLTTVGTNVAWATPAPSSGSGTGLVTSVSADFRVSGGELSVTNTTGTGPLVRQSAASGAGTVTSVSGASSVSGLGFSGSPVTGSGTLTLTGVVAEASIAAELARLAGPLFTGDPRGPTSSAGDNDTSFATTAFLANRIPGIAYDATSWNGNTNAPTMDAVRDKIESMGGGGDASLDGNQTFTGTNTFTGPVTISGPLTISTQTVDVLNIGSLGLGTNIVAITNGGTGATTASAARTALGADNGDNITSGTVADARIASSIARDSEVSAAYQPLDPDLTAMAAGTAVATAQTNAISVGAPTLIVGTTNVASALAAKAPLASPAFTTSATIGGTNVLDYAASHLTEAEASALYHRTNAILTQLQGLTGGTAGQIITATGAGTFALSNAPSGGSAADVQVFTNSGTWTKPSGKTMTYVIAFGGGGGGGAGRRGADGTIRSGGAGGASGAMSDNWFLTADLGASETVTVGMGGVGGTAQTSDSTNGANGAAGTNTTFGAWLWAGGGAFGGGGDADGVAASTAGNGRFIGIAGGASSATGAAGSNGNGSTTAIVGASGAGGGGITSGNSVSNGGSGGEGPRMLSGVLGLPGGTAGTAGGSGGNGASAGVTVRIGGSGGGGGASSISAAAGAGGNGGYYGAGGGGGGASLNGNNSGAGGSGGNGIVVVISY